MLGATTILLSKSVECIAPPLRFMYEEIFWVAGDDPKGLSCFASKGQCCMVRDGKINFRRRKQRLDESLGLS